jgi:hypothetical protein
VFYVANTVGTYPNYGGLSVADGEIAFFTYNGSWGKITISELTQETGNSENATMSQKAITKELSQLGSKIDNVRVVSDASIWYKYNIYSGETYTITNNGGSVAIHTYDENKNKLETLNGGSGIVNGRVFKFTASKDAVYFHIFMAETSIDVVIERSSALKGRMEKAEESIKSLETQTTTNIKDIESLNKSVSSLESYNKNADRIVVDLLNGEWQERKIFSGEVGETISTIESSAYRCIIIPLNGYNVVKYIRTYSSLTNATYFLDDNNVILRKDVVRNSVDQEKTYLGYADVATKVALAINLDRDAFVELI